MIGDYQAFLASDLTRAVDTMIDTDEGEVRKMAERARSKGVTVATKMSNTGAIWVLRALKVEVGNEVAEMALNMAIDALKAVEAQGLQDIMQQMEGKKA